jgi:hypothetical protein
MKYNELTKEIVNERLLDRQITLVGDYLGARIITEFQCNKNHRWKASPSNVLHKSGCPHCSNKHKLTVEQINERIKHRGIELISGYETTLKKALFRCVCGHEWLQTPGNVMNHRGCRKCAKYGFSITKQAYGYVLKFGTFLKYGVSNNLDSRLYRHKIYNGDYELMATHLFETGRDALDWELKIKYTLGGNYVGIDKCPDGYTETLPLEVLKKINFTL